jgi:hypothetical protein
MTFENDIFTSFKDARQHILGSGDYYKYYNPETGRPITKLMNYKEVVLYGENEVLGYKSLTWLKKTSRGKTTNRGKTFEQYDVVVRKELFDQYGEFKTFNELWDAFINYIDFQR